jgi:hypothetical protein
MNRELPFFLFRFRGKPVSYIMGLWLCRQLGLLRHTLHGFPLSFFVFCDESGHAKFPFSYVAHVTLLTPAQGRIRAGSGRLRIGSVSLSLAHLQNHFWKAAPQHPQPLQL